MPESEHYSTQNIYEAAFLLAKGFKLKGKSQIGQKVSILFVGEGVMDAPAQYYNGALIKARAYTDAYRTLKDYIFER